MLEAAPVPDDGIERREEAHALVAQRRRAISPAGMSQVDALDVESRDVVAALRERRERACPHRRRERACRDHPRQLAEARLRQRRVQVEQQPQDRLRARSGRALDGRRPRATVYTLMPSPRRATCSLPRKCSASSTRVVAAESLPQPLVAVRRPSTHEVARMRRRRDAHVREHARREPRMLALDAKARRAARADAGSRARVARHARRRRAGNPRRAERGGRRDRGRRAVAVDPLAQDQVGGTRRRADRDRAARSRMRAIASASDAACAHSERAQRASIRGQGHAARSASTIDMRAARAAGRNPPTKPIDQRERERRARRCAASA